MAAWLTVYCSRPVSHLTAANLQAGIEDVDFSTIAEGFGIEDDQLVEQALNRLRIESTDGPESIKFRLHYRPPRYRPVLIHLWTDPERVREECKEALEQLGDGKGQGPQRVRAHLSQAVEVAALELGWGQLENMGIVLAGQVAEYLATVGAGLIQDQNDDWWEMKGRAPGLLVGPKRRD